MEAILMFLLGASVGSFLNVLADRLPVGQGVLMDRSRCDWCKKTLRWFELVPLLSFLMQRGKCRRCRRTLRWQYPAVELVTAIVFVSLFLRAPVWNRPDAYGVLQTVALCMVASAAIVIFVADLKYTIIPDSMTVLFGVGVILYRLASGGPYMPFILTGVGFGLFFFAIYSLSRGKAMGFGDVKLAPILGVWLGFPAGIIAMYVAFLTGATVGVILMWRRIAGLRSQIAFGPFLLVGSITAFLYGENIWQWWLLLV